MSATATKNVGRIEEIQGVVIEAVFPDELPEINHAITIDRGEDGVLVCEVQQHLGDDRGGPITLPGGRATLGGVFNVLGDASELAGPVGNEERWPIHRPAPTVENLTPTTEMFETGIKVVDLLAPYAKGGKVGLFGGAGVGKTVLIQEL